MNKLPPEVHANICEYLPRRDLKSFRFLLRNTRTAAERFLFRDLYVQFNLKSLERLDGIALHPYFGKYVRSIDYDVRKVSSDSVGWGVEHWRGHHALKGMNIDERDRQTRLATLKIPWLERHYAAYIAYVSGIEYLMRRGFDMRMLLNAIEKFPALQEIRCSYPAKMKRMTEITYEHFSPIAQEILEEPSAVYSREERTRSFWALLDIAFHLKYSSQLTDIHVSNASMTLWNELANSKSYDLTTLSALRHLTAGFELDGETGAPVDLSTLRRFCAMPSLESLSLVFDVVFVQGPMALFDPFDKNQHWCNLTALSLKGIVTTESDFQHFLVGQAAELKSLELSNIHFDPVEGEIGSWVDFLKFLNEKFKLTHVKFNGMLSNSSSEYWVTYDYNDDGYSFCHTPGIPYPDDCLKYRIERFVTHAAEDFPFYPMPEGVEPGILPEECTRADNGWMWKPDKSWTIHKDLLR